MEKDAAEGMSVREGICCMISTGSSKIVFGDFFESWLFENGSEELKLLEASVMMRFDAEIEGLSAGQDVEFGGLDWTASESILFHLWTSRV
jgi:hypothetical protein